MMLWQFIKYGVAGGIATFIHILLVLLLVEAAGLEPVLATIPAFLAALVASYLVNHRWTFAARGQHGRHFPRYAAVAFFGLGMNLLIMSVAVDVLRVDYAWGLVMVVMTVPLMGFLLQRHWSFSPGRESAR